MKASAFNYARAVSVSEALELLQTHGERAKVLAGGQSLMPAMNLRLVSPELIVDIGELAELRGITATGTTIRIGALTRHADLARAPEILRHAPLLAEALRHVAHPAIRNRGTLGGSLAQGDPASELPACMLALNAIIIVRGQAGERRIAAADFFTGIYETALSPQELLVAVELPVVRKNSVHFFHEFARRHGDFAIVACAAVATEMYVRLAVGGVADRAVMREFAADSDLDDEMHDFAAELDARDDLHATADYRRDLVRKIGAQTIAEAKCRA